MNTQARDEQLRRLNTLSDALFGEPDDLELAEAEEVLRMTGIDPDELKARLYQRMQEKAQGYSQAKRPVPPLLEQAIEDLRPTTTSGGDNGDLTRTARAAMARLLEEIKRLPTLLEAHLTPTFTAAYRKKKELSARDKKLLDSAADELRKRAKDQKGE